MNSFVFSVLTPEREVYHDDVVQVTLPTVDGEITVNAHHMPLVGLLASGEVRVTKQDGSQVFLAVSRGIVEMRGKNRLVLLADTSERAEHIDVERAEAARTRVEEMLQEKAHEGELDFARFKGHLAKELARIHVGRRRQG
jgi:F-type H+-transporting ATPase subunit epsilon